jgi:molybdopterin/thiamine biosynthesis adenylyltransferase/rhodanese-related sulfurtransferase
MSRSLSREEKVYYARQITLPEVGEKGQEKLKNSAVLLIGLGGLGSPLALYLAGVGIGRIGICEFDKIEISNLHRQVLYGTSLEGKPKIEAGVQRLKDLNPYIEIETYPALDVSNAREIVRKYDVVADGADNFATRYLVNDACVLENRPLVSASILGFEGQLSVFHYQNGPCYRCLYPKPPPAGMAPSCNEAGVLGVLPGVMGTLQATEVIKICLDLGQTVSGKLLTYDALSLSFSPFEIARDQQCAVCGAKPTITELKYEIEVCVDVKPISAEEVHKDKDRYLIIDVRESAERAESFIEDSIHVPLAKVLSGEEQVPKGKPLVLQCAAGGRSQRAAEHLAKNGYTQVFNLTGGMKAWQAFVNRR